MIAWQTAIEIPKNSLFQSDCTTTQLRGPQFSQGQHDLAHLCQVRGGRCVRVDPQAEAAVTHADVKLVRPIEVRSVADTRHLLYRGPQLLAGTREHGCISRMRVDHQRTEVD